MTMFLSGFGGDGDIEAALCGGENNPDQGSEEGQEGTENRKFIEAVTGTVLDVEVPLGLQDLEASQ